MKKFIYSKTTFIYLAVMLVVTIMLATAYVALQQTIRQMANQPQVENCQGLVESLNASGTAGDFGSPATDIKTSLANFFIIYDKTGKAITSTANLNAQVPTLPPGVIDYTNKHDEDRITWQPEAKVRIAAVIRSGIKYDVLCGRSLKESEKTQDLVLNLFAIGWAASMVAIVATWPVLKIIGTKKPKNLPKA